MEEYVMERIEKMKSLVAQEKELLMDNRLRLIWEQFINEKKNLFASFISDLKALAGNKTGNLTISYLRSSIITREHIFWVAFYTNELFVEEEPPDFYFSLLSLFEPAQKDLKKMINILEKNFIRIFNAEKEEIYRWYMEQLYKNFGSILKIFLEETEEEKGINIYYGGYMEEVVLIGRI